jgi:AcrR family transcriptional regulator
MKRGTRLGKSAQKKAAPPRTRTSAAAKGSRRGTLSREAILRAALDIADREGLSRLTIRKLASAMKVTPMAVYRHFANKSAITDGILDFVAGEGKHSNLQGGDWRGWVRATLSLQRTLLRAHRGVMPLLGTPAGFGPNALRAMNDILTMLVDAGFTEPMAAQAYYVLTSYSVGAAAIANAARTSELNASRPRAGQWFAEAFARCGYDAASRMPTLARLAPHLADFASDEQYLYGLDQILAALDKAITGKRQHG